MTLEISISLKEFLIFLSEKGSYFYSSNHYAIKKPLSRMREVLVILFLNFASQ